MRRSRSDRLATRGEVGATSRSLLRIVFVCETQALAVAIVGTTDLLFPTAAPYT